MFCARSRPKKRSKHTIKNFGGFHNHPPLLTMMKTKTTEGRSSNLHLITTVKIKKKFIAVIFTSQFSFIWMLHADLKREKKNSGFMLLHWCAFYMRVSHNKGVLPSLNFISYFFIHERKFVTSKDKINFSARLFLWKAISFNSKVLCAF